MVKSILPADMAFFLPILLFLDFIHMETKDWIQIENAYYVYNPDVWTPMANGVVSFESEEKANEFVQEQGKGEVLNYEQLLEHRWGWEG